MIQSTYRRLTGAIIATVLATLALVGCTPATGPNPTSTPTPTVQGPPNHYEAHVIDVLAGDKLRVQVTNAVYLSKGERTLIPSDLGTIVVKDPTYDAPAAGECGFEQSRDHLVTAVFKHTVPWKPVEGNLVTVTISRNQLDETGVPATDGDTHLMTFNHQQGAPSDYMLGDGYARVGELVNPGYYLYGTLQEGQRRGSEHGLWQTCWGQ